MKTSEPSTTADDSIMTGSSRRPFPVRLLMVCFTIWLIATEVLIFDQIKFNVQVELLEQATRSTRRPQLMLPMQPPSHPAGDAHMEQL